MEFENLMFNYDKKCQHSRMMNLKQLWVHIKKNIMNMMFSKVTKDFSKNSLRIEIRQEFPFSLVLFNIRNTSE